MRRTPIGGLGNRRLSLARRTAVSRLRGLGLKVSGGGSGLNSVYGFRLLVSEFRLEVSGFDVLKLDVLGGASVSW